MKKLVAAFFGILAFTALSPAQTVLSKWTFENMWVTGNVTSATLTGLAPEFGSGTASGVHASSATVFSSPAGNGSVHSFSANTWAVGDYFQFQTSTLGYSGISLTWDQTSSSTGPRFFNLEYSLNGSSFTTFAANFLVLTNAASSNNSGTGFSTSPWSSSTAQQSAYSFSYDLSSVTVLDNASSVYFRLTDSTAPGASGGTDRVDNFTVTAAPEPSTITMAVLGGVLCLGFLARWRKA
jgi:hypothetical protein